MAASQPAEPFVPRSGHLVASVPARAGREIHVVREHHYGELQTCLFLKFPPGPRGAGVAIKLSATLTPDQTRELARALMVAAQDEERRPGTPPPSWLRERDAGTAGDGAPVSPARASGGEGGDRGH